MSKRKADAATPEQPAKKQKKPHAQTKAQPESDQDGDAHVDSTADSDDRSEHTDAQVNGGSGEERDSTAKGKQSKLQKKGKNKGSKGKDKESKSKSKVKRFETFVAAKLKCWACGREGVCCVCSLLISFVLFYSCFCML